MQQTGYQELIRQQLESLDYQQLEAMMRLSEFHKENPFSPPGLLEILEGLLNGSLLEDPGSVLGQALGYFLGEFFSAGTLLLEILVICIIGALLKNASEAEGERAASAVGMMACHYAAVAIAAGSFTAMYAIAWTAIDEMTTFMQALLPMMVSLLVGSGAVTAGAFMSPVMLGAVSLFATVCRLLILPALFLSCSFYLINSLTEQDYIKSLASLIRKLALFVMGLGVLLFSGLSAVQSMVSAPADSLFSKAARYSIGHFVPVIGSFAADSIDLIRTCTALIKAAAGLFGVLALLFLLAVPLLKLLAGVVIYKLAAVVLEPIGDRKMSECMNQIGSTLVALCLVVFLTALMFLFFIAMMAAAGQGGSL